MTEKNQPTFKDWEQTIAIHAARNEEFRAAFLADPKATIERYAKQKLPGDVKIHAHVNSEKELHFVLPDIARTAGGELSDEDLERVAGGEMIVATVSLTIALGTVVIATVATIAKSAAPEW